MKKTGNIVVWLVFGFFAGVGIGHVISIIVSAIIMGNKYGVVVPSFLEMMGGNETLAATISALICGILGLVFMLVQKVWAKEEWSLLKRTVVYYFSTIIPMFLAGGFLRWFNIGFLPVLLFVGIFTAIFMIIWVTVYLLIRKEIKKINEKLNRDKQNI